MFIDTAVNIEHPELKESMLPPYKVINPNNSVVPDIHGTHVAGIISAKENNKIGAHGINPKAKVMSIDISNNEKMLSDYYIAKGILHAVEQGIDVINMSFGSPADSAILQEAIQVAVENNVVVVAAAGNESRSSYSYPAAYDGVISVGATDANKELAEFSNYGPSVDVVAPGVGVFSTIATPKKPNTYAKLDGTSMASPVVAGVASLIKSKYPDLNSYEVEALLKSTANDLGEPGYDNTYAHGLVNPVEALKYDVSKLPNYDGKATADVLQHATEVTFENGAAEKKGSLTKPFESHSYKMDLEAGSAAQFALTTSENFDYKLRLYFYPEGSTEATETVNLNDLFAGETEGGLFKAPGKGTLVAEVVDANGNYATDGSSAYTLTMNVANNVKDDMATPEQPYDVTSLPFASNAIQEVAPTLISNGSVDTDYYRVRFPHSGYANVNVAPIVGLDTAISIYPEGKLEEYESHIIGNNARTNEKESVSFPVNAHETYIVEVTGNQPIRGRGVVEKQPKERQVGTILPYELHINMAQMPNDEDNFIAENKELDLFGAAELTPEVSAKMLQNAIPVGINDSKTGVLQTDQDVDLYKVKVEEDTILNTTLAGSLLGRTDFQLYEYDEEAGVLVFVNTGAEGDGIGMILEQLYGIKNEGKNRLLQANKQYVIATTSLGSITGEPYELKTKKIETVVQDEYGENDTPETATPVELNSSITDRLITSTDTDVHYLKITDDVLASFMLTNNPGKGYPISLTQFLQIELAVIEDKNGNKMIDPEEEETEIKYDDSLGDIVGSLQGKKGSGYFFTVSNQAGLNLNSYTLSFTSVETADEDKDSVVTKNIPSKPLSFKEENGEWTATGLYNGGVAFGDSDYYLFNNNKKQDVTVSVTSPVGLDSVVSIYNHKGRLIQKVDTYFVGDIEEATVNLNKGRYYIKVGEAAKASSNNPYTVNIKVK
ncbi:hypothetical protein BAMA_12955 [Bacillus manliponensis]|uniref:Peptidase S8/S53 domain-containing protein n=1 Tax=Bacillus manliponensis TaxID=574376 RepID=A0A073K5F4_9BACI|nr:S8 family serine peptidase [Bacillus manliponensis]KEK17468.1 hypothetical protein BAMA_12955 [Bacillus manliponensis]